MRIAVITQPLISNYGGLLQNWALLTVLRREFPDADVLTFDQIDSLAPIYLRIGSKVKSWILRRQNKTPKNAFDIFIEKNINSTDKARSLNDFKKLDRHYAPDAYIVGSDQVWRPSMVFNLDANFLSFTKCKKKIAYAASFGINRWEFTPKQTTRCRQLINGFTAVSVRENDGVSLCSNYLGCEAVQVLDPTLLLKAEDYDLLMTSHQDYSGEYAFTYILDTDNEKQNTVKSIICNTPEYNAAHDIDGKMPTSRLSVEEWLTGIRNARMVICDSFHGVAFSIIFNKDFYVLENHQRGNSRLNSLLSLFGLTERLVNSPQDAIKLSPIDWQEVNIKRDTLIRESLVFLHSAL